MNTLVGDRGVLVTGAAGIAERSLVACLRWAVAGYPSYERSEFDRIRALASALVGEDEADGVLSDLITLLAQARAASGVVPDVARPGSLHVSPGEMSFLSLLASMQRKTKPEAIHAAISFSGSFEVGYVVEAAERLGQRLSASGWPLSDEGPGSRAMLHLASLNEGVEPSLPPRSAVAIELPLLVKVAEVSSVAGRS